MPFVGFPPFLCYNSQNAYAQLQKTHTRPCFSSKLQIEEIEPKLHTLVVNMLKHRTHHGSGIHGRFSKTGSFQGRIMPYNKKMISTFS